MLPSANSQQIHAESDLRLGTAVELISSLKNYFVTGLAKQLQQLRDTALQQHALEGENPQPSDTDTPEQVMMGQDKF